MKKSTKNTYKPTIKGNLIPVVRMADGGNVSELNYSDRKAYIESHYAPFITDAQMIFSIYDSGIEYNYKGDRKEVVNSIIESYKSLADYTEITLPQETIYEIKDWELVRKDIDPDTDDVIGETPLKELSADNTYNFSYNGLVDLNWRVYEDEEYERYFYVITPHLGGDIRGNYGDAFILQGNDKDELFYRYYEGFISGGASIYLKFKDGSEIAFDSEQDSDVFYFRLNEIFEPTGMAKKYLKDFEKFETWYGDEFLEESIDIYLMRKGEAPKMMAGGSLNDETPMAYIQVLGYNEGQWFNLTDYSDGQDVIDGIYDWMNGLNTQFGGNREEYEVTDYEGFGSDLYDQYMSSNEFDEIIEGYEKYENSDFHSDIITAYRNDSGSGSNSLSDVIDEMDNNFFGKYESLQDFGYEMVQQGVYEPSDNDVYITDTDKRILAGEEADAVVDGIDFDELLNIAQGVKSEYESEISDLENKISDITTEIDELTSLQDDIENADDEEYEIISDQIEEKEVELDDIQNELDNIDSSFEDRAREEARDTFYDEIYDKLENDLSSWLEEYGYTENLQDISFLSVDYEKIGDEIGADYLIIEYDGQMYFFSNYAKGGRLMATKQKPKYDYYIVESSTKKLVSGYSTKKEALEQRKLLIEEYPSMRFEIYTLGNLESKTDLDVFSKKDYVQLSTLDKIKKVSVDAFRYGKEKVGQANEFLVRNDVKGKIKRGARNVADKTKQGFNWLRNQWNKADFGDGKGKAKFFADGGGVDEKHLLKLSNKQIINDIIKILNKEYTEELDELLTYYIDELNNRFDWENDVIDYQSEDDEIGYEDLVDLISKKTGKSESEIKNNIFYKPIYSYSDGGGVDDVWIALSKTKNGLLLSERFDKQITNKQLFDYYKKRGYEIIDGNIFKVTNKGVLDIFKDAISKFIKQKYNELVDWENTLLSYEIVGDRIIAQSCFVQTKNGNEYKITPNDLVNKKFADGGMVNKIIGIAKTHPYSNFQETYAYPTSEKVPPKFFNDLGITLENQDDYVLVLEIQFDTKKIILQGYYGTDGENYDGAYSYQPNQLSDEFQKWLVNSLLKEIKRIKDSIRLNKIDELIKELEKKSGKTKKECQEIIEKFKQIEETKFANGGRVSTPKYYLTLKKGLTITNELYQDTFKTGIQYSDWGITAEQYKKLKNGDTINIKGSNVSWDWQFKVTKDMVERIREIKTNDVEFADGGSIERYNLHFNYNPSNLANEDAELIVSKYTKDWKHNNDWDEVSFYVFGLTEGKANELKSELNGYDTYNVEIDKSRYAYGGGVENAEMPTRERTTITRPTTTPTTTPSKPDKDNPYKPKIKPRPKASKYNLN